MARTKELLTAVGTLGCAVGIGFVMQSSESAAKRYGDRPIETVAPAAEMARANSALLNVEEITLTAAEFDETVDAPPAEDDVQIADAAQSVLPEPDAPSSGIAPACEIIANARPMAAAMVNVTLDASCLPNERVTVHHSGMVFTQTTSLEGKIDIAVPALAKDAVFVLAFSNGDGAVAQTAVEDLDDFERVVLQWKGDSGFQIHAREYGANYGEQGHVWYGAPGEVADAVTGDGGFIARSGDMAAADPLLAEVYSFPSAATGRAGDVALSVETEVSEANCGLEIEAQSLELTEDGSIKTRNLTLAVPECDAIGDFLVLNNLLQDLKVASR